MRRTYHVAIAAGAALIIGLLGSRAWAESDAKLAPKVKEAMQEMISECGKVGVAKLDGSALLFGSTKMNGNYTLVDSLKEKFKCTATFFAKKGDGFVRIATNVIKDDGSRAVGTNLHNSAE